MARMGITLLDGSSLKPGDWLQVERGIGKFGGIWEHPDLGLTWCLNYFRSFDDPATVTTLFGWLESGQAGSLEGAIVVVGPMKRDGTRPRPLPIKPDLRVVDGGRAT